MKKKKTLKKILTPGTDSVKQDPYDKQMYKELVKGQKLLKEAEQKLGKFYPPITDLNRDVFSGLYKAKPEFIPPELIKATHKLNHNIMGKITEAPKYNELRESTKLDPVLSMMGASNMQEEVEKILEEEKEEIENMQEALEKAQQELDELLKAQEAQDGEAGETKEGQGGKGNAPDDQKLTLEEAKKKLAEELAKVDKFSKEKLSRTKVNNMIQRTNEHITEVSDLISNWGLDRSNQYMYAGHEGKLAILDELKNSRKLREIAEFLGRLKMLKFREGREKTKKGYEEVTDITESRNIEKMLVSEMLNLMDEDLKLHFITKVFEGKLLTYKLKGKSKNERGPIVCCIDSSGSMSGNPEIWAKGVAMGLLETARNQKRDLFVIHFSDGRDKDELKVHNFNKSNHHNVHELLDFANYFESGGTMFHPALDRSRELIGTDKNYKKADIVFVTDGQSVVEDAWLKDFNEWRIKNKVHIISILINEGGWGSSDATLKEFSNKVHKLTDVMGDGALAKAMDILADI
jgi:uncharacterized protein with von Willebrand factor type A (vWA) domain